LEAPISLVWSSLNERKKREEVGGETSFQIRKTLYIVMGRRVVVVVAGAMSRRQWPSGVVLPTILPPPPPAVLMARRVEDNLGEGLSRRKKTHKYDFTVCCSILFSYNSLRFGCFWVMAFITTAAATMRTIVLSEESMCPKSNLS